MLGQLNNWAQAMKTVREKQAAAAASPKAA
jgi:hypothetical protein